MVKRLIPTWVLMLLIFHLAVVKPHAKETHEFRGFFRGTIVLGGHGFKHSLRNTDGDEFYCTNEAFDQVERDGIYECSVLPRISNLDLRAVVKARRLD